MEGEWQPVRRVAPRVHTGELLSTVCALALAPLVFALPWFGAVGRLQSQRSSLTTAENAWSALSLLRWVMMLTVLVAVGATVLHATQRGHGSRSDTGLPVAVLGSLSATLVGYRVLIAPPDPAAVVDTKLGAYLGLLAALGIALGGFESMREERERPLSLSHRTARGRGLASDTAER